MNQKEETTTDKGIKTEDWEVNKLVGEIKRICKSSEEIGLVTIAPEEFWYAKGIVLSKTHANKYSRFIKKEILFNLLEEEIEISELIGKRFLLREKTK